MSAWVLILFVMIGDILNPSSVSVVPIYFQNEDACIRAASQIKYNRAPEPGVASGLTWSGHCVSTATGETSSKVR